jgi:hypothetical protein
VTPKRWGGVEIVTDEREEPIERIRVRLGRAQTTSP